MQHCVQRSNAQAEATGHTGQPHACPKTYAVARRLQRLVRRVIVGLYLAALLPSGL